MITEYIRYHLEPERSQALVDAYARAGACLARSEHSLGYDVAQCADDPSDVIVRMAWDSAEGHLEGFRSSSEFQEFFALVRPFTDAITEMRHYAVVAGPGLPSDDRTG